MPLTRHAVADGASRAALLATLDAEFRQTSGLLAAAMKQNADPWHLAYRQAWLREALCRFLAGDDARARELLDQVCPAQRLALEAGEIL